MLTAEPSRGAMPLAGGFPGGAEELTPRYLWVQSGLHAGARIPLRLGSNAVGRAAECDVLLADVGIDEHHLEVVLESRTAWLRRRGNAQVLVDGRRMDSERAILRAGAVVTVGECSFTVAPARAGAQGAAAGQELQPAHARRSVVGGWAMGVLLVVVLAVGGFYILRAQGIELTQGLAGANGPPAGVTHGAGAQLAQGLQALKLPGVKLNEVGKNSYRLSGHVDNQEQAQALAKLVRDLPSLRVESNISVGSQVAAWIRDSLASPELAVQYAGNGEVTIEGVVSDPRIKARLQQVHAQFSRVTKVTDKTRPPDKAVAQAAPEPVQQVSLYRALAVRSSSSGAVSYVLADAKSKYMVGAVLPDGNVLESLTADAMVVRDKAGRKLSVKL